MQTRGSANFIKRIPFANEFYSILFANCVVLRINGYVGLRIDWYRKQRFNWRSLIGITQFLILASCFNEGSEFLLFLLGMISKIEKFKMRIVKLHKILGW